MRRFEGLILEGSLRPGDRLPPERELAGSLAVSRPVLRDALAQLEAEGLIVARKGDGTFVGPVAGTLFSDAIARLIRRSPRGLTDFLEFRKGIETFSAALAAERASEADRLSLMELRDKMLAAHEAGDSDHEAALDVELHALVQEAAHNTLMLHLVRGCHQLLTDDVFENRRQLYRRQGARERLLGEHLAIIEAILAGDPKAASAASAAHIDHVAEETRRLADADERAETARRRRTLRSQTDG